MVPARLILQTGEIFEGLAPDWVKKRVFGEVVFTTGMTGYVESLTDPSYAGQILTFTYPLIGNYGVPSSEKWESDRIHAAGAVFNEISPFCEHWEAIQTLAQWLRAQKVPFLTRIDTRALTKTLRIRGVALGAISKEKRSPTHFPDPNTTPLASHACMKEVKVYGRGKKKIIAVDCGMKENIVRHLLKFPITVKRVPVDYDYSGEEFDGIFLSNGPGDPAICRETVEILQKAMKKKKPLFGICLGAQLLALGIGAKTYKLPYGHRGQNQPCKNLDNGKCYLTSQNHGYAIDEKSLPKGWKVTFRNLNDGSVEGIEHTSLPLFAVQFHPEASPGPIETAYLFEKFYKML